MERKFIWTYILIGSIALVTLIMVGDGRLRGENADTGGISSRPAPLFSFKLEIAGQYGLYDECRGLGSSNEVEEDVIQTAGGMAARQKTPGALEWHDITLRRAGPTESAGVPVWSWRKAMEEGNFRDAIKDGAITLLRIDPPPVEPLARWEFHKGWVASLSFDGSVEEITIVHEGLERTDLPDHGSSDRSHP